MIEQTCSDAHSITLSQTSLLTNQSFMVNFKEVDKPSNKGDQLGNNLNLYCLKQQMVE